MEMASRIRRSWTTLAGRLGRLAPGDPTFLHVLRDWLRTDPAEVSVKAAEALTTARGVALILDGDAATLPMSRHAADNFVTALRGDDLPRDPVEYVAHVDRLCWSLAVFERDDDCCPVCQGELELWSDGTATHEHCTQLGCCFDAAGTRLATPAAQLRPATRAEVRAHDPSARLV